MNDEESKKAERDELNKGIDQPWGDFLGMNDPEVFIDYECLKCGFIDPVPEFIVDECTWGDEEGDEPMFHCPQCDGATVRKEKAER